MQNILIAIIDRFNDLLLFFINKIELQFIKNNIIKSNSSYIFTYYQNNI